MNFSKRTINLNSQSFVRCGPQDPVFNSFKLSRPVQNAGPLDQAICTSHADMEILAIFHC